MTSDAGCFLTLQPKNGLRMFQCSARICIVCSPTWMLFVSVSIFKVSIGFCHLHVFLVNFQSHERFLKNADKRTFYIWNSNVSENSV